MSEKCDACEADYNAQLNNVDIMAATILHNMEAELRVENQSFGNVLAVIHRDGGHYITQHGHKKASEDAIEIVTKLRTKLAEAEERNKPLDDLLRTLSHDIRRVVDGRDNLQADLTASKERYKELKDTVQISCNPPDDCNDPKVLKTYMKACFEQSQKGD